jgi:hypothetical protein
MENMSKNSKARIGLFLFLSISAISIVGCTGSDYKELSEGPIHPPSVPSNGGVDLSITAVEMTAGSYAKVAGKLQQVVRIRNSQGMVIHLASQLGLTGKSPVQVFNEKNIEIFSGTLGVLEASLDSSGFSTPAQANPPVAPSPSTGPVAGGTYVSITGQDFDNFTNISFGQTSAISITFISSTQLLAEAPAAPGGTGETVNIYAVGGNGAEVVMGEFNYTSPTGPAPTITDISPSSSPLTGGETITITGTNFTSGMSGITFSNSATTAVSCNQWTVNTSSSVASGTQGTCTTPALAAGSYTVTATASDGQFGTWSTQFVYSAGPQITSLSPNSGAAGTTVNIVGSGFDGTEEVLVNGTQVNSQFINAGEITIPQMPAGIAGSTVPIEVVMKDSQESAQLNGFTYSASAPATNPPTLSLVTPNPLPAVSQTVTLTGANFNSTDTVVINNGIACTSPTVVSATQLTCVVPVLPLGNAVFIVQSGGQSSGGASVTVINSTPAVPSITVSSGTTSGTASAQAPFYMNVDPIAAVNVSWSCTGGTGALVLQRLATDNGVAVSPANVMSSVNQQTGAGGQYTLAGMDMNTAYLIAWCTNGNPSQDVTATAVVTHFFQAAGGPDVPSWGVSNSTALSHCLKTMRAVSSKCAKDATGGLVKSFDNYKNFGPTPYSPGYFVDLKANSQEKSNWACGCPEHMPGQIDPRNWVWAN